MEKPNLGFQLVVHSKPRQAEFILEVINQGSQKITVDFSTGQEFDFAVTKEDQEVWRWSGDMMFIQAFHPLLIKAGQTVSYKVDWDYKTLLGQRLRTGDYVLQAYFLGVSRTEPVAETEFLVP